VTGWLLIAVAIVAQQAGAPRDTLVQPTIGNASISGRVVNDEAEAKPVRRAIVTLTGPDLRPSRGAITDDDGRFTIANLPAGRVTLTVSRASFITSIYGAKRPGRPGTPIAIANGQKVEDLVVKIWRGAVIAGVLRDDTGAPVEGISVTVTPARTNGTAATLSLSNNPVTTNDQGEYRIFGLAPGSYVVSASPSSGGGGPMRALSDAAVEAAFEAAKRRSSAAGTNATGREPDPELPRPFAYAPVYFPGTPILAQAQTIVLAPGQEHLGADFAIQRVATSVVSGRVSRADGLPAQGTQVQVTAVAPQGPFSIDSPLIINATAGAGGAFEIPQVPPGDYTIVARGAPQGGGAALWAATGLSVAGADVEGLSLSLEPGATVSGKVVFDGKTTKPPENLTRVRIGLIPVEVMSQRAGTPVRTIAFTPPIALAADGSFAMTGVPPGRFMHSINGVDEPLWFRRSAQAGGIDLFDRPIDIAGGSIADLVVTFSERRSELSGTLQTSGGAPATDVFVVTYAIDPTLWGPRARRVQAVRPSVDGKFLIKDLPPGDYYISAVTDVDQEELQEPRFLESLIPASLKITIGEGEKKVQDLKLGSGGT